jgi:hypothetical protein
MSRGFGHLQRAILDALPAYEVEGYPGVYDLKPVRWTIAERWGRLSTHCPYRQREVVYLNSAFAASFSLAVATLIRRQALADYAGPFPEPGWMDGYWRRRYVRVPR